MCNTGFLLTDFLLAVIFSLVDDVFLYMYRVELEGEIRLTVDDLMREELKNLKMVSVCSLVGSVVHSCTRWLKENREMWLLSLVLIDHDYYLSSIFFVP